MLSMVTLLGIGAAALLYGGCSAPQPSPEEDAAREFGGAAAGARITEEELNGLTRAFADRYVSLLYSVCDRLKAKEFDPEQRRAAQVLLVDNATNVYDIASNADAFTRMLDLVVVTNLVSEVWADEGRAATVFGEQGQRLADALTRAEAESWTLAGRVLTADQLETLESLIQDWHEENPQVTRPSFVRFSNFALGRGKSAADKVLEARGLLSEVGQASQSVDEARVFTERMFYWLKRGPMLLRWQAGAIKNDWLATPELDRTLEDTHRLTDSLEQLPENVAAEREAILTGIGERLQQANGTIANIRGALNEADEFTDSLKPLSESVEQALQTGDDLFTRFEAWDRWKTDSRPRPFDIREYEQTVNEVTRAAERMNKVLARTEHLLGAPKLEDRMQAVNESIDGRITTAADESQVVMDAFFWRVCALLVVLFALLILYRLIVFLFLRDRNTAN